MLVVSGEARKPHETKRPATASHKGRGGQASFWWTRQMQIAHGQGKGWTWLRGCHGRERRLLSAAVAVMPWTGDGQSALV